MDKNSEVYTFEIYNGKDILDSNKELLLKMNDVVNSQFDHKLQGEIYLLQFLNEDSTVVCLFREEDLLGFSWLTLAENIKRAELSWFFSDKDKVKGLESKRLLDKSIEYCKDKGIESLKFNCSSSWSRIKNKNRIFENFGYKISEEKDNYDVSLDIMEK